MIYYPSELEIVKKRCIFIVCTESIYYGSPLHISLYDSRMPGRYILGDISDLTKETAIDQASRFFRTDNWDGERSSCCFFCSNLLDHAASRGLIYCGTYLVHSLENQVFYMTDG
jgi:hypothetical protein